MSNDYNSILIRTRLSDAVTERLRDMIIGGMKPGDRLPTEKELAQNLGVGRSTVREGLMALSALGIIVRGNEGTFVCKLPTESFVEPLSLMVQLENAVLTDILELREILELESVAIAIERATREDIFILEKVAWEMDKPGLHKEEFIEVDMRFHHLLVSSTGNAALIELLNAMRIVLFRLQKNICFNSNIQKQASLHHKRIIKSILAKDTQAARQVMKEHLLLGRVFHGFLESVDMMEYETTISKKEKTRPSWWDEGKGTLDLTHLDEPSEASLELTEPDTMENFRAKVIICNDKDKLKDPCILHVYDYESMAGRGKPMLTVYIQLVEKIEDPN